VQLSDAASRIQHELDDLASTQVRDSAADRADDLGLVSDLDRDKSRRALDLHTFARDPDDDAADRRVTPARGCARSRSNPKREQ
jgi:hypothetical protein